MTTTNPNKIILHRTYAEMIVEQYWLDLKVKISLEDIDKIKNFRWTCLSPINSKYKYFGSTINGKKVKLHRFLVDCPDDMIVDHINRRTLDNRRENLRICTISDNMQNTKKHKGNKSGYKNIYFDKYNNTWRFEKTVKGKRTRYTNVDVQKVIEFSKKFYVKCVGNQKNCALI